MSLAQLQQSGSKMSVSDKNASRYHSPSFTRTVNDGMFNPSISSFKKVVQSTNKNPIQCSFAKSKRNFEVQKDLAQTPAPNNYDNNVTAIGSKSTVFKNNANAVIGRQNVDVIDMKFNMKEKS